MARPRDHEALPEAGMGGSSDSGAHGKHPASAARLSDPLPDDVPGDAAIERRHRHDPNSNGPERRLGPVPVSD